MAFPPNTSKLILVESPSKARSIQSYLNNEYKVVATGGHILDIPASGLSVDIKNNFSIQKQPIPNKQKIVKSLQASIKSHSEIIVATDPDREGEAIAFDIMSLGNYPRTKTSKKWIRCGFREITPEFVKWKLENPDQFRDRTNLAQETRRILDRLFGYLISPVLWKKIQGKLSAGRVQSVLLRWICEREEEIRNFQPEKYLYLDAWNPDTNVRLKWNREKKTIPNPKLMQFLEKRISHFSNRKTTNNQTDTRGNEISKLDVNETFTILNRKESDKRNFPQPPHKTSTLQREASKVYGFPPKKTMKIAQSLFEGMNIGRGKPLGLITYPRTDSTRLSDEAVKQARSVISKKWGKEYLGNPKPNESKGIPKGKGKIQDAHEAIRPTLIQEDLDQFSAFLSPDQWKIYRLIYRRFFAFLTSPQVGIQLQILADGMGEKWSYESFQETFPGYTVWYETKGKNNELIPGDENKKIPKSIPWQKGDKISIRELGWEWKETEPPPRYNHSALVKKMETTGVGRPSTYSPSIEVLSERQYVSWEKTFCYPTKLGEEVNLFMKDGFSEFIQDDFTKNMEDELDQIEEGIKEKIDILLPFHKNLTEKIQNAPEMTKVKSQENLCPECKKGVVRKKKDKKGKLILFCSRYPDCDWGEYA